MKKLIVYLVFLLLANTAFAQDVNITQSSGKEQILQKFELLPDAGYSFKQVRNINKSRFISTDSLKGAKAYWLKVILFNNSFDSKAFELKVYPNFDNTLYYYNAFEKKWLSHRSKFSHRASPWQLGLHPYEIPAQ